jgi:hypothetical protein
VLTTTTGSLGNFFSYFTIESNLLAIIELAADVVMARDVLAALPHLDGDAPPT